MNDGCPLMSKSHREHDERIRELEAFQTAVERTPRILADRVVKLEKGLKTMYGLLPKDRQAMFQEYIREHRGTKP